jgi:phenylacetate-CoA ligase
MDLGQWFARRLFYPLSLWRSGKLAELRYRREFARTQFLPPEELRDLQLHRLRTQLEHAYRNCPFYRRRFDRAGLLPGDVRRLEDLAALPPLEKAELQRHREELVAQNWPREDRFEEWTGGSTGTPVSFFYNLERKCSGEAATWRHNNWAGWDVGHRSAALWGAPRDAPRAGLRGRLRSALLQRQIYLDTGHMTEEKLHEYHERLKSFRPRVILAYARSAVLLARYLERRGLTAYRPHSLVTSAEVLTPDERGLLERVFGCPVFNRYGSREVGVIASECERHAGLHTMAEGLYVEVVRGDRAAAPGETGAILVTDLLNRALPLIRYRIGDAGSWEGGACPCGRGLPRLRSVAGRVTEFLVGADSRLVSGVFLATYVVGQRVSLGQVQIEQTEPGRVLYRVKPGPGFDPGPDLGYLEGLTRRYLGEGTVAEFELVEELRPEPSGKFRFSRSTVVPDFLAPSAAA